MTTYIIRHGGHGCKYHLVLRYKLLFPISEGRFMAHKVAFGGAGSASAYWTFNHSVWGP